MGPRNRTAPDHRLRRSAAVAIGRRGAPLALAAFLAALEVATVRAQGPGVPAGLLDSSGVVEVSAVPAQGRVAPGAQVPVAVVFDLQPGWHIQTNDPVVPPELGDASYYIKTEIVPGATGGALRPHTDLVQWPPIHMAEVAFLGSPVEFGVFDGKALAYVPVTVDRSAASGTATLDLAVTYQACDDIQCLAPVIGEPLQTAITIAASDDLAAAPSGDADLTLFSDFDPAVWEKAAEAPELVAFDLFRWKFDIDVAGTLGLVLLLGLAALGGMLLNFTPCVLPMIPLKIMGLQKAAGSRRRSLTLGAVMALGVVAFWLLLGGLIAGVAGFTAANQLFQYPAFSLLVGAIIAVMAMGMMGRFTVTVPQAVHAVNPVQDTYTGSFIFGGMIGVLSTPCTAPFMGAAAAWAATRSPGLTLATFGAIGVGMAMPYLALAAFPQLLERVPRTGPASQLVKDIMALLMLAAAAYFLGIGLSSITVRPPDPPSRLYWWGVAFFIALAGLWLSVRTYSMRRGRSGRGLGRLVFGGLGAMMIAAAAAIGVRFTQSGPIDWTYYTPDRFETAMSDGNVVVMEFSAEWCLNCKALEEGVLHQPAVVRALGAPDVVPIKVDLTGNNTDGNAMLQRAGRVTIPLLIVYAPDGTTTLETDFYTVDQVVEAVRAARKGTMAAGSP